MILSYGNAPLTRFVVLNPGTQSDDTRLIWDPATGAVAAMPDTDPFEDQSTGPGMLLVTIDDSSKTYLDLSEIGR